jgi:hypothetical protein
MRGTSTQQQNSTIVPQQHGSSTFTQASA